jgi:hypothetical protein
MPAGTAERKISGGIVRLRALLPMVLFVGLVQGRTWIETSQADFADGRVDPSMYVSFRSQLEPDSGCVEFFTRFDVDNNGYYDLGCSDDSGPYQRLYLGTDSGYYYGNHIFYPTVSGGNIELADLNLDGFAELVHSGWRSGHATIYWGTMVGPDPNDTTVLAYGGQCEDVCVYDLDKDGYLDIILGSSNGTLYIFWGTRTGYSSGNRTDVAIGYSIGHNTEIGDFDQDGWGDIAFSCWTHDEFPIVYWGPGRTPRRTVWLPGFRNNAHGQSIADLNGDDWLDIVFTGYDTVIRSYVYFGSPLGFSPANRTEIHPGQCYGGSAVVDWNGDGLLDIVYLRGNWIDPGGHERPRVYYSTGSAPWFNDVSRAFIGRDTFNASGGFVADFNFDGNLDIFVNNMLWRDSSYILWGPTFTTTTTLPISMDHHGVFREPGNIYNRTLTAFYMSSILDAGADSLVAAGTSAWTAYEPPGSLVSVFYRSGSVPVPDSTWTEFYEVPVNGGLIPDSALYHRYLQYRLVFKYARPCYLPDVEEIQTNLVVAQTAYYDVAPTQIIAPAGTVDSGMTITPRVVVANYGNTTVIFPVTLAISSSYNQTVFDTLDPGTSDTVAFPNWTADQLGFQTIVTYTALDIDQNRSNDTLRSFFIVTQPPHQDVGPTVLLAPVGIADSGTVITPRAVVLNYGNTNVVFPVTMVIGAGYTRTVSDTLNAGESDTVYFPSWTASPVGTFAVTCYTALVNDERRANDTVYGEVEVPAPRHIDVGVQAILSPPPLVDSGMSLNPRAAIRNHGNTTTGFPITFTIGTSYAQTLFDTLAPGESDTLTFPLWTANDIGVWPVVCYTALSTDENRTNDTARSSVEVIIVPNRDVGVVSILSPPARVDSGTSIVPSAVVINYGNEVVDFPVTLRIGTNYTDAVQVSGLAPGRVDTVAFRAWDAAPRGLLPLACTTALSGDGNPFNDAVYGSTLVQVHDVAALRIGAPRGRVQDGDTIVPWAEVHNYGNTLENFTALFRVSDGYEDTIQVQGLAPDSSRAVTFAGWGAVLGRYATACSVMLGNDMFPANNKVEDSVRAVRRRLSVRPDTVGWIWPASFIDYRIRVTNLSVEADTVDLIPVGTRPGWGVLLLDSAGQNLIGDHNGNGLPDVGCADSGSTVWVTVRISDPADELAGTVDTTAIVGRSSLDTTYSDEARLRTIVLAIQRVAVAPSVYDSVAPGGHIDHILRVSNLGNDDDLIDVEVKHISPSTSWFYQFFDITGTPLPDRNMNGRPDVGILPPLNGSTEIILRVTAPPNAPLGLTDTVEVWAYSGLNSAASAHVTARTMIRGVITMLVVDPDCEDHILAGINRKYQLHVETQGNMPDAVGLTIRSNNPQWTVALLDAQGQSPLPDSNLDQVYEFAPVMPGTPKEFTVSVTAPNYIPDSLAGPIDSLGRVRIWVKGVSFTDVNLVDSARIDVQALPQLAIHNFENPFRAKTTFIFSIPHPGKVRLYIYDRTGALVRKLIDQEDFESGIYSKPWDASNDSRFQLAPGTYVYVLELADRNNKNAVRVRKKLMIR